MIRAVSYSISVLLNLALVLIWTNGLIAQSVRFDCPAYAVAKILGHTENQYIVEVRVPVSTTISDSKFDLSSIKTQVFWNRNAFPIVDFAPKTALQSKVDGPVSVEKKTETSYGLGAKVSTSYLDFLTPSVEANAGKKNSEVVRYNEIPEHQLLLASGTIKRGTGAYFQFKPSRTESLEGSRDLIVAFEVPVSWRGGVLQVTTEAVGSRKKFGVFHEDFEFARVFVLPIYLEGDDQARQFAQTFAQSEQRLRQGWSSYELKSDEASNQFQRVFGSSNDKVPSMWMHHLIQSGSDVAIRRYESKLPNKVATAANDFVQARKNLLNLSN